MSDDTTNGTPGANEGDDRVDPLDPRAAAVSAYVDGEATDDEVRLVESDPSMLADVQRLQAIRAELRRVTPLEPSERERLLDAALAELDAGGSAAGPGPAPTTHAGRPRPVVPPAPPAPARRSNERWLAVAAAVVGVVATAGLAVALVTRSGDDDDATSSDAAVESPGDDVALDDAAGAPAETASENDRAGAEEDSATEATASDTAPPEVLEQPEAADETAVATRDGGTGDTEGATGTQPSASSPGQPVDAPADIESDTELIDWVLDVENRRILPPRADERACGRRILGQARSGGDEVVVARAADRVLAFDADTCAEVLETDAPD